MRKSIFLRGLILVCVALLFLIAFNPRLSYASPSNAAPSVGIYEITWYSVDGGGAMNLTGGAYTLSGTIGQPDAGIQSMVTYTLNGGFWNDGVGGLVKLFLPLITR